MLAGYRKEVGAMVRAFVWDSLAFAYLAASGLLLGVLWSYNRLDPSLNVQSDGPIQNWLGASGAIVADLLMQWVGVAAFALPVAFGLAFLRATQRLGAGRVLWTTVAGVLLFACVDPTSRAFPPATVLGTLLGQWVSAQWRLGVGSGLALTAICFWLKPWALVPALWFWERSQKSTGADAKTLKRQSADKGNSAAPGKPQGAGDLARRGGLLASGGQPGAQEGLALPPLSLLKDHGASRSDRRKELQNDRLQAILEDFGIKGQVLRASPGPIVTLYELEPAAGVKSSRIISLADDIARNMSALSARVSVIPGHNLVGIEISNVHREMVHLKDLLATPEYTETQAALPLVLGKDISGQPVVADLTKMPHLLVAGTTGSGKSVGINSMILSLLYRLGPDQCKMIMIDPKMLELSLYDDIPHLLTPVITEPKKAIMALKWVVQEMESRYRLMSQLGVRNVAGYNQRLQEAQSQNKPLTREVQVGFDQDGKPLLESQALDLSVLPYIVVIVDEMADLMLVAGKELEVLVQRLAQMARAAGIHLIMATQRPSVDVITGTIKANFPTRISFQVTSKIDSRTILGEQGAEHLLGHGDMLYMAAGGRIVRVHGPFVSDQEIENVVGFLKEVRPPDYIDLRVRDDEVLDFSASDGADNDFYRQAVEIIRRDRKVSISYIQRQLQIGYNRAARLVEQMEKEGVISPANHLGKREILG
jgi:DNA segregation ATPase FtsK/SpoIIIE, S-DNA-T family